MGIIYCATNKVNGKKYIGYTTKEIEYRRKCHEKKALKNTPYIFHRALMKYGFENFEWKVLFDVENERLNTLEIVSIRMYKTKVPNGYNMTDGGDGTIGLKKSKETRKKLSDSMKSKWESEEFREQMRIVSLLIDQAARGRKISARRKGHEVSLETREKLSKANLGKLRDEKTKSKISSTMKGREFSEEHKANISKGLMGVKRPCASERNKENTGKTYEEMYGEEKAKEIKEKLRQAMIRRNDEKKALV